MDLETRPTRELLRLWAAILRELRRRGIVRTANNPIGDIAEALVARHFKGERAGFSYSKVILVVFDSDLRVAEALAVDRATVEELFRPRTKDGARVIRLTAKLRQHPAVESVALSDSLLDE